MFFPLPGTPGGAHASKSREIYMLLRGVTQNCVKNPKNPENGVLPGYYTPRAKLQELYIL
jgi:hypothetical protein